LEDKFHRPGQIGSHGGQRRRDTQLDRDVNVMATSVHDADVVLVDAVPQLPPTRKKR
jgi:hypothetical protein